MKRILATALAVLLIATMAISGSVAYLTSTDNAENTFTMGEIKIEQHEKDSEGNIFEQDQQILPSSSFNGTTEPSTGLDNKVWTTTKDGETVKLNNGEIDKFVTVENTGKNPAYVRTIFAFEDTAEVDTKGMIIKNWNDGTGAPGTVTPAGQVLINSKVYNLYVYTYTDALQPAETTGASLRQVAMSSKAGNAEVEAIRGADGNGKYSILVATQAVQAVNMGDMNAEAALNAAFGGAISSDNNPWMNGEVEGAEASSNVVRISTAEEFKALGGGNGISKDTTIVLEKDIDLKGEEMQPILSYGDAYDLKFDGQNHTISNVKLIPDPNHRTGMGNVGLFEVSLGGKLTVENLTLKNITGTGAYDANSEYSNCWGAAVVTGYVSDCASVTLKNIDVYDSHITNNDLTDGAHAAIFVGYTTCNVNMTDCNAYRCTVAGNTGTNTGVGALVGCANTDSCAVNISDCAHNVTKNSAAAPDVDKILGGASVTRNNVTRVDLAISTKEQLKAFADAVNKYTGPSGSFSEQNVVLLADIDLKNELWEPIGQSGHCFYGNFNGNGHTIRNLKVVNHTDENLISSGLFGWTDIGGTIENLNIDGAYIEGHHNCGVIYGSISGSGANSVIKNCTVKNAEIKCTHVANGTETCGDKAGGIAGMVADAGAKVQNCKVENISITAGRHAGYIVGYAVDTRSVTNCSSSGEKSITGDGECDNEAKITGTIDKEIGNAT